jgi:hypothetical protein
MADGLRRAAVPTRSSPFSFGERNVCLPIKASPHRTTPTSNLPNG